MMAQCYRMLVETPVLSASSWETIFYGSLVFLAIYKLEALMALFKNLV